MKTMNTIKREILENGFSTIGRYTHDEYINRSIFGNKLVFEFLRNNSTEVFKKSLRKKEFFIIEHEGIIKVYKKLEDIRLFHSYYVNGRSESITVELDTKEFISKILEDYNLYLNNL